LTRIISGEGRGFKGGKKRVGGKKKALVGLVPVLGSAKGGRSRVQRADPNIRRRSKKKTQRARTEKLENEPKKRVGKKKREQPSTLRNNPDKRFPKGNQG